jgi:hypothetical protein
MSEMSEVKGRKRPPSAFSRRTVQNQLRYPRNCVSYFEKPRTSIEPCMGGSCDFVLEIFIYAFPDQLF